MSRSGLSSAMLAEIDALQNRPGHLFECYFDDETVYATDFYTTLTWNGHSYAADGDLLSYDGIEETLELRAAEVRVVLSGVDQSWISRVLAKNYVNRRLVIRKAFLDAGFLVIADPAVIFDGPMRQPVIAEDPDSGTCEVAIAASHMLADVDAPNGRRTNDKLHQVLFPGDGFFKYAQQAQDQVIWVMP